MRLMQRSLAPVISHIERRLLVVERTYLRTFLKSSVLRTSFGADYFNRFDRERPYICLSALLDCDNSKRCKFFLVVS